MTKNEESSSSEGGGPVETPSSGEGEWGQVIVQSATKSDHAYSAIKRAVIRGELHEGVFLTAEEAERRFGVGRTPFREACNRLSHERLLEVVPRRGFRVTELSFREVRELLEARVLLEGAIAELAAARATPEQINELARIGERDGEAADSRSANAFAVEANKAFHLLLAEMAQNSELVDVERRVLERYERLSYQQLAHGQVDREEIQNRHDSIVAAIGSRDPEAARKAVERDIREGQMGFFEGDGERKY